MDVEVLKNSIQREIVKLSKDMENLIKEGIEQHPNDDGFKTLMAEREAKHNNKPTMQTGETSDKVEHTTEINDNNIKVGFDLSRYNITCSMMEELEPCLNGSVKSVREPEKKSSNTEELIPANFDLNITQMTPIRQAGYSFNMEEREIA
ncbi:hypothetical protein L1987_46161 [Smallanthus sonchifolius]|uniref:Uncharacterized protein n=1 Tax=Smallanthus sonchifolius TaxID=185202 RepID=A0ACB9G0N6_9ASTR|nr:hypothetical protein L1987_46161 [Smallanthus sonchifolius]